MKSPRSFLDAATADSQPADFGPMSIDRPRQPAPVIAESRSRAPENRGRQNAP